MASQPTRIIFTLLFSATYFMVKAQSGNQMSVSLGIGVNNQLNQNSFFREGTNDRKHIDFSLNTQFEYPFTKTLHLTASASYVYFDKHATYYFDPTNLPPDNYQYLDNVGPFTYLPVSAGFKYYLLKYVYVAARAGSAFEMGISAKTSFVYSGEGGVAAPFNDHNGLDFSFRFERGYKYNGYDQSVSLISVNVAYKYRF